MDFKQETLVTVEFPDWPLYYAWLQWMEDKGIQEFKYHHGVMVFKHKEDALAFKLKFCS